MKSILWDSEDLSTALNDLWNCEEATNQLLNCNTFSYLLGRKARAYPVIYAKSDYTFYYCVLYSPIYAKWEYTGYPQAPGLSYQSSIVYVVMKLLPKSCRFDLTNQDSCARLMP